MAITCGTSACEADSNKALTPAMVGASVPTERLPINLAHRALSRGLRRVSSPELPHRSGAVAEPPASRLPFAGELSLTRAELEGRG